MNRFKDYLLLVCIVVVAIAIRFCKLGEVPVGPNWDEAALGWNAYSILKTGRDEYGERFPLSLRSYDDYKPPLYMYLAIPSVAIFGLDLWSTRLPAAINGVIAVIGVFFLVREFSRHASLLQKWKYLPYLGAFLLAISPWHVHFSRIAFEANIGVTLNIWGIYALLRGLRNPFFFVVSGCLMGASLYAYHSQRVFIPLLILLFFVAFRKEIWERKRYIGLFFLSLFLTILPLIPVFTNPTTLMRLRGTSTLADTTGLLRDTVRKLERDREMNSQIGLLLDNRRFVYAKTILNGYLSHFSLKWLFLEGDNARHHAPRMGLLYHIELPLLFVGLLWLIQHGKKVAFFILGWMLIAPIPASPTTELPHAIRTLVFLPTFQIVIAIGTIYTFFLFKSIYRIRYGVFIIVCIVGLWNVTYYLSSYFIQQNYEYSEYWQYGYKQAVEYAVQHYDKYETIVVSTKLEQPHMFFLFHLRYDPSLYLSQGGTKSGGFKETQNAFDKFRFRPIQWENEKRDGTILYIGTPSEIPHSIHTIYYLNGIEAIRISS